MNASAFWNRLIKRHFGAGTSLEFPRFFPSKKNQVTLLNLKRDGEEFSVLAKYFVWGDPLREWDILQKAGQIGLNTPAPHALIDNVILMEYIPGRNMKEMMEKGENIPISKMARWLAGFHGAFLNGRGETLLRGDAVLPNFIQADKNDEIYGLDFEEAEMGDPVKDLAEMNAVLAITGLAGGMGDSMNRVALFMKEYQSMSSKKIDEGLFIEKLATAIRRRIRFNPSSEKKINRLAHQVEENGRDFLIIGK